MTITANVLGGRGKRRLTKAQRGQIAMNLAFFIHFGGANSTPRQLRSEHSRLLALSERDLLSELWRYELPREQTARMVEQNIQQEAERGRQERAALSAKARSDAAKSASRHAASKRTRVRLEDARKVSAELSGIIAAYPDERAPKLAKRLVARNLKLERPLGERAMTDLVRELLAQERKRK